MTQLDQSEYVAERLKELNRCRRNARINLTYARQLQQESPCDLEIRELVVKSISNLEICEAMIDSLRELKSSTPLRWQGPPGGSG